ncbi:hypothetical protein PPS11_23639 [Pseudomonas putida S11]|nr:hypothetical protein PPS11_23639 [Pseudomonas putida S11]
MASIACASARETAAGANKHSGSLRNVSVLNDFAVLKGGRDQDSRIQFLIDELVMKQFRVTGRDGELEVGRGGRQMAPVLPVQGR